MSAFAQATAVTPRGDGRYGCELSADWSALAGINGGILMAIIVRAIGVEVGPDRALRSLQCQFMRPPKAAAAEVVIETIRSGARATNLRIRLQQGDKVMLEALAVCFASGLRELKRWSPPIPVVAAVDDDVPAITDPRLPSVAERVTYSPRIGPAPISGTALAPGEPARTGGWLELNDPQPVDLPLLAFFADAWWPAALGPLDEIAFNPTIDMTLDIRTALPPEGLPHQALLIDVLTQASLEGLCDEDVRLFTADGVLLAQARQLAITLTPADRPMVTRTDHSPLQ